MLCPLNSNASTTKAPKLSRLVRAHTYIKCNRSEFWYPNFLESFGVKTFLNPNIFYLQNLNHLTYHNKILQGGPYDHNVYKCTLQHTWCHVCEHKKHVYAMEGVYAYVDHVSYEKWIPISFGSWHIGSKWSPNNHTLLQSTNIIFNNRRRHGACIINVRS